jgi:anaerobic magnesium-protoporphyrin IX monomethyl ester cyclase
MFRGTYSSNFYRAIRNLMHEQVKIEQLDQARHGERYRQAQESLELRWASLQMTESAFRVSRAAV